MDRPTADKLKPTNDWFIVKPIEVERKSAGGVIMPNQSKQIDRYGKILAVGPGFHQNGVLVKPKVEAGQTIMFRDGRGLEMRFGGENILFMTERDLLAVISE